MDILKRMLQLVNDGRVSKAEAEKMLTDSGVELVVGAKTGTYDSGMLRIGEALHPLDPNAVSTFRANAEQPKAKQPKAEQPKAEQPKAEQPKAEQPKDNPFA